MEVTSNGSRQFEEAKFFNSFAITAAAIFRLFGHKSNPLLKVTLRGTNDWEFCFALGSHRIVYYQPAMIAVSYDCFKKNVPFDFDTGYSLQKCLELMASLFDTDWLDDVVWSKPSPLVEFTLPSMKTDTVSGFKSIALLFDMLRRKHNIKCQFPVWRNDSTQRCGIEFKDISNSIKYTEWHSVSCGGPDLFTPQELNRGVTLAMWLHTLHASRISLELSAIFDADPTEFVEVVTAIPSPESKPTTSTDMATQPKDALSPVPNGKLLMEAEVRMEEERIAKMRLEESKRKQLDDVLFDSLLTAALWEKKTAVSYGSASFRIPTTTNRSVADRLVTYFGSNLNGPWRRDAGTSIYFEVPLPQSK